ncbi:MULTISPECIES: hypothetical protein [Acetivibrio]|uniref:hypothetical protein n=1 Tax=Acetivibrio TaxID=35829 RepID=UPI00223EF125|nr:MULTISPECIES: hypothetical protein [Acetivibrio]HOA80645.1 hypothetical protein [Defluviitaleaceae bacterium]HOM02670.1 hypothetical protein [Acetivibrio sp.]HOV25712.1 hypothetical protein [Pseudobacteroides sp.]
MSQEDVKIKTNEQAIEKSSVNESVNEVNGCCCEDSCCDLFSYKRPTEEDRKKTKRKTCC